MKRAIGAVAITCRHTQQVNATSSKKDDLGHVLSFLRAAERVNLRRMQECSKKYAKSADFVHADNQEARIKPGFIQLKDHAVILARQEIMEQVEALRQNAST